MQSTSRLTKHWATSLLAALATLLGGCYDTRQIITLNPDGSGKADLESVFIPPDWWNDAAAQTNRAGTAALQRLIQTAEGVEAWRDVSSEELPDGRIRVRGTAYFPQLNRFKTELNRLHRFELSRTGTDALTIAVQTAPPGSTPGWTSTNRQANSPDVARERQKLKRLRPLLAAFLEPSAMDTTLLLPGAIRSSSNFERPETNQLRLRLTGARLLAALDRVLDEPGNAAPPPGRNPTDDARHDPTAANALLYGERAPVRAVVSAGGAPRFDYALEVDQASRTFPALAQSLGLPSNPNPTIASEPATSTPPDPAQLVVTGAEWQFQENDFVPGSSRQATPRYTLRVRAQLAEPILAARAVEITRATTTEGLPLDASVGAIQVSPPRSLEGPADLRFAISMASPPPDSRGLARLEGVIVCERATRRRTEEIFSGRLQGTAPAAIPGSQLEFIPESPAGTGRIVLHTSRPPASLQGLEIRTAAGRMLELKPRGTVTVGSRHSITFVALHPLPTSGLVSARAHDGRTLVRVPFALTNVSLLGQPLAAQ
jgi:hypothetical protein